MRFTKMHGLGNNYLVFSQLDEPENVLDEACYPELSKKLSDVHFGVGSDGIILISASQIADFQMRIFNKDGSEARNCGNGLRCVAKYVYDHGHVKETEFTIETMGGTVGVQVEPETGSGRQSRVRSVTVDMGTPGLLKGLIPMIGDPSERPFNELHHYGGESMRVTSVSMGNPHAIIFTDDVHAVPLERVGPLIEHSPIFPERVNVGWVQVNSPREIEYRVWERGSGVTLACGTGACAAVVAASLHRLVDLFEPITVRLPGGVLTISWEKDGHVRMRGEADYICCGELMD